MLKNILLSTSIIALAAPAFAGGLSDPIVEAPAAPVAVAQVAETQYLSWTGFYVGGQVGSQNADSTVLASDFFEGEQVSYVEGDTVDLESDGTFYGIHAGYMYDLGRIVVGAEFDYDIIDLDEAAATYDGETDTVNIDEATDDTIARLKLRAGYDAGRFLPYATAGMARWDSDDENTNGVFFGAGVAFAATDNILIGGEILQHQFKDAFDTEYDIDATTMSLRASYKF